MTLNQYLKEYGVKIGDLTDAELKEVHKELEIINSGGRVIDSVLDSVGYRKEAD